MSEYQYYGFLAIDRPLTCDEQEQLRALSTRARITATSFTNEYQWGNFRGDPRRMVERYYDAHLYLTNWGTRQVILRVPKGPLTLRALEPYCVDECVVAWTTKTHLVLDLRSEDEGADWEEGAEDSLGAIAGVRAELGGIVSGQGWWPGSGSNRRPSAFQAKPGHRDVPASFPLTFVDSRSRTRSSGAVGVSAGVNRASLVGSAWWGRARCRR
ncbi:hypothetical protein [Streptacidiphilus sp. P02-A3a]|uniref:hypothetical protein n=1 Tax=Streptacidiphilus sp. P02-A3a TaxID=2704468 RepID=UPI0015FC1670|nr:hypothetical protein [Streptacidiphilus sp. P02-A3a]